VILHHLQIAMPEGGEEMARHFYRDLLGIPEVEKPENLRKRGGCWFECGNLRIHLGIEKDFRSARKAHPAFLVEDLAELVTQLRAANVMIAEEEPLEGFQRVYVADPFGNRIEMLEKSEGP
jgi:catechol 2,3-dioxygenase-like lactoylglutathione lyase family enzyme